MSLDNLLGGLLFIALVNCPIWFSMDGFFSVGVASYFELEFEILVVSSHELVVFYHQLNFLPIQSLDGFSNLDCKCWSKGYFDSCCSCQCSLLSQSALGTLPMNDHCHRNHRIRHVLTRQDLESWVVCSALNFSWHQNTQIGIKPKPLNLKTKDLELRDKTSYTQISKEGTNNKHTREFRVVPNLVRPLLYTTLSFGE